MWGSWRTSSGTTSSSRGDLCSLIACILSNGCILWRNFVVMFQSTLVGSSTMPSKSINRRVRKPVPQTAAQMSQLEVSRLTLYGLLILFVVTG